MKRLSDYKDEEAIDLWADLLEPIGNIASDKNIAKIVQSGGNKLNMAKEIIKSHKSEVVEILLRIDDTPLNGLNIVTRLVDILTEIESSPELKDFLGLSEQEKTNDKSFGSATGSTKAKGK